MVQLEGELGALAAGEPPGVEPLTAELEALPLVIGADGVMVPFRPHPRTAKGKTRRREIKVAILARLGARGCGRNGTITPDRKSTRLNSSHSQISYAVFCLEKNA